MSLRLVLYASEKRAVDEVDCPRSDCGAPAGTACMRSGGAVVGGSPKGQRFGEYLHAERYTAFTASYAPRDRA